MTRTPFDLNRIFPPSAASQSLYVGFSVNSVSEALGRGVYMWVYDNVKRYYAEPGDTDVNVSNLSMDKVSLAIITRHGTLAKEVRAAVKLMFCCGGESSC